MKKQKVSFEMDIEDHKRLKIFCVETNINMKDFMINTTLEKLKELQKDKKKNG